MLANFAEGGEFLQRVTTKFGVIGFTLTILNILKHAKPHHVILFNTSQV